MMTTTKKRKDFGYSFWLGPSKVKLEAVVALSIRENPEGYVELVVADMCIVYCDGGSRRISSPSTTTAMKPTTLE